MGMPSTLDDMSEVSPVKHDFNGLVTIPAIEEVKRREKEGQHAIMATTDIKKFYDSVDPDAYVTAVAKTGFTPFASRGSTITKGSLAHDMAKEWLTKKGFLQTFATMDDIENGRGPQLHVPTTTGQQTNILMRAV
jgi:hypothetical protein